MLLGNIRWDTIILILVISIVVCCVSGKLFELESNVASLKHNQLETLNLILGGEGWRNAQTHDMHEYVEPSCCVFGQCPEYFSGCTFDKIDIMPDEDFLVDDDESITSVSELCELEVSDVNVIKCDDIDEDAQEFVSDEMLCKPEDEDDISTVNVNAIVEKSELRKMNIGELRQLAATQHVGVDASKMKKDQLISLLADRK